MTEKTFRGRETATVLVLVSVVLASLQLRAGQDHEQRLAPGPFHGLKDARLGSPIKFENEIETYDCFPLMLSDITVVAWVADAYVAEGELLIRRCIEYDPSIAQTAGSRHGGAEEWERARLSGDQLSLVLAPIGALEWGWFSNPSFCGKLIAHWGLSKAGRVTARIFDVTSRKEVASRYVGIVTVETDNRKALTRPEWTSGCSTAAFDAGRFMPDAMTIAISPK